VKNPAESVLTQPAAPELARLSHPVHKTSHIEEDKTTTKWGEEREREKLYA